MAVLDNDTIVAAKQEVAKCESQLASAHASLDGLLTARKPLALVASGDGEASRELSENRDAVLDTQLRIRDAETRLEAARAVLVQAERAAADAAAEAKLAEARQIAAALLEQSKTFDQAVAAAAAALQERERLRMQLNGTGCLRTTLAEGLGSRSRIRSAFAAAGDLHRFLDEFVATRHRTPLAGSDSAMIVLSKPTECEAAS